MRRKVYLAQMGAVDMGIDLRRRDVGMPQNLLQDTKVGTARKHMGCKRMTKRMGMQPLDTHQAAVALADGMNGLARYASYSRKLPGTRRHDEHEPPAHGVARRDNRQEP